MMGRPTAFFSIRTIANSDIDGNPTIEHSRLGTFANPRESLLLQANGNWSECCMDRRQLHKMRNRCLLRLLRLAMLLTDNRRATK